MYKKIFISLLFLFFLNSSAHAFWIWTPDSGKWVNPKYEAKNTPAAQLAYANDFFDSGKSSKALKEYQKLVKKYPRAYEAAEAQFKIASCMEVMGKYYQAVNEYQNVIDRYPFSNLGPQVTEKQFNIANLFLEGKAKDSHFATSFFGDGYNVVEVFRKVIKNDPYGPYAPESQYKIGLFFLQKKSYQEARDEFEKTMNDFPATTWADSARYQIALVDATRSAGAQYDQQITGIAIEGLTSFVKDNPGLALSEEAQNHISALRLKEAENAFVVGEFYEKREQFKAARMSFQEVVDEYADTPWGSKAERKVLELMNKGDE